MEKDDDCDIDVDFESYKTACEVEGGQVYEPTKSFQCKQGLYITTVSQSYITCVGASCKTDEFSDAVDEMYQNYTDAVGAVLDVDGIECELEFSAAYGMSVAGVTGLAMAVVALVV